MRPVHQAVLAGVVVAAAASAAVAAGPTIIGGNALFGSGVHANVTHTWTIAPHDSGKCSFSVDSGLCSFGDHDDFICFADLSRTRPTSSGHSVSSVSMTFPFIHQSRTTFRAGMDTKKLARTDSQAAAQLLLENQASIFQVISGQDLTPTSHYHPIEANVTVTRVVGLVNAHLVTSHNVEVPTTVSGTVSLAYEADLPGPSKPTRPDLKGKITLKFTKARKTQ